MEILRTSIMRYAGDLYWVEIVPLSAKLIGQFADYKNNQDSIQLHYEEEVIKKMPNHQIIEYVDMTRFPRKALVKIQTIIGLERI